MNTHSKPNAASHAMVCVYDGRECVGFVLDRGRRQGFEAFGRNETSLGSFGTQGEAVDAVSAAAREASGAAP
jgi:hypothetical protein